MHRTLRTSLLLLLVAVATTGCGTLTGGGEGRDRATAITTDESGGAYVSGTFEGQARLGSSELVVEEPQAAFLARVDREGELAWAVSYPSESGEQPTAMATDGDHVYIAGRQAGRPRIVKLDREGNWITSSVFDGGCSEFVGIYVTVNRVITACNTPGQTGLISFDKNLDDPARRDLGAGWAQIRDLQGTRNGIYVLGEFQTFIRFTRRRPLAGFPPDRTILFRSEEGTALFVARLDPFFHDYEGSILTLAARSLGADDDVDLEAASLAVSDLGDLFVAGRFPSTVTLEPGQPALTVQSAPGSDRNFFLVRLDGGLPDPINDGNNAALDIEWQNSWGSNDMASLVAIDFRSEFVALAGTFEGEFETQVAPLRSLGGRDVFYMLVEHREGEEVLPVSGGGLLDEEVWDVGMNAFLGAVAGSLIGQDPEFPRLVLESEDLDVEIEIPETFGERDILIWKLPSSVH